MADEKDWLEAQAYALWKFRGGDKYREWGWLTEGEQRKLREEVIESIKQAITSSLREELPR